MKYSANACCVNPRAFRLSVMILPIFINISLLYEVILLYHIKGEQSITGLLKRFDFSIDG